MCGRFFSLLDDDALAEEFSVIARLGLTPRYNIAPTQALPVVHRGDRGKRLVSLMRWGLVPGWAKEVGTAPLINARAETVAEKPSFRGAYRHRRALVPASGWYEWQRQGTSKQPFALHFGNHAPCAFAAIWEVWEGRGEGSWLESVAILTTSALGPAASVHDRMPVLVEPQDWPRWLEGDPPALSSLAQGWIDRVMATPVSSAVGNVANQGPGLIEPLRG